MKEIFHDALKSIRISLVYPWSIQTKLFYFYIREFGMTRVCNAAYEYALFSYLIFAKQILMSDKERRFIAEISFCLCVQCIYEVLFYNSYKLK